MSPTPVRMEVMFRGPVRLGEALVSLVQVELDQIWLVSGETVVLAVSGERVARLELLEILRPVLQRQTAVDAGQAGSE